MSGSCCSKDEALCSEQRFPDTLCFTFNVQRQTNTSIDALHEATTDDHWHIDGDKSLSEPWIGVTRFALLTNKSTRMIFVGSRQNDEKSGPNKTGEHFARRMVKHVKRLGVKIRESMGRRKKTKLRENSEAFTKLRTMILIF